MFARPLVLFALCACLAAAASAAEIVVQVVDRKGKPVADAVVWLMPLERAAPAPDAGAAAAPVEIQQRGQEFEPALTVVRVGTSVRLPNRDRVEHHVYSESAAKRFDLPLYAPGKEETVVFDQPGIVALGCNIHDWMAAHVVVVDTPWHARTGENGSAEIAGLPAGRYRAELWHVRLGKTETREIAVIDGPPARIEISLALKPDRRVKRPKGVPGLNYP